MIIPTPWGNAHTARIISNGLDFYTTASHGGIKVKPELWEHLKKMMPAFQSYAGEGWLEEDCDANAAALLWPEFFTPEEVFHAVQFAELSFHNCDAMRYFTSSPESHKARTIAAAFGESVAGMWQRGSMTTHGRHWTVWMRKDQKSVAVIMKDYPEKNYYTDAEISALRKSTEALNA